MLNWQTSDIAIVAGVSVAVGAASFYAGHKWSEHSANKKLVAERPTTDKLTTAHVCSAEEKALWDTFIATYAKVSNFEFKLTIQDECATGVLKPDLFTLYKQINPDEKENNVATFGRFTDRHGRRGIICFTGKTDGYIIYEDNVSKDGTQPVTLYFSCQTSNTGTVQRYSEVFNEIVNRVEAFEKAKAQAVEATEGAANTSPTEPAKKNAQQGGDVVDITFKAAEQQS